MAILFTKEGYDKLKVGLRTAEKKRPELVATLSKARAMGDLSENGFYKGARFELNDLDRKIRHLKDLIAEGQVIRTPSNNNYVQIGHTVTIKRIS